MSFEWRIWLTSDPVRCVLQVIADGAEEVTPVQPTAESKPEEAAEDGVVSTLKKSQAAAAEREAGEQVSTAAHPEALMAGPSLTVENGPL